MVTNHENRKYTIVKYDPKWKDLFEEESKRLKEALGSDIEKIEHVGSTSVTGMVGKPTIDIDIVVENISLIGKYEEQLKQCGYESLGEFVAENAYLFAKEKDGTRLYNLHLMEVNHPKYKEIIAVRDYLRSHPDEVRGYSDLKLSLFKKYQNDYGSYRKEKDVYMKDLKARIK